MEREIYVSPEELFFMGKYMQAAYIDYDYMKMVPDIQQNYRNRETEIRMGLIRKHYLTEDFSGNVKVDDTAELILNPVFFGQFEVEIIIKERSGGMEWYKFHFCGHQVTEACWKDSIWHFNSRGADKLNCLVVGFLGKERNISESLLKESVDNRKIDRVMVLKNIEIGKSAACFQFLRINGGWYMSQDEMHLKCLDREFLRQWLSKGGEEVNSGIL